MKRASIIFEPGDMVAHSRYVWLAVRLNEKSSVVHGNRLWRHTNIDAQHAFTDKEMEDWIESGEWQYLGNHGEKFPFTSFIKDQTSNG